MDFSTYFNRYENLVNQINDAFEKVKQNYSNEIKCKPGCSDCCYALFDLTLIEALYLKTKFDDNFSGKMKHEIITISNKTDRQIYKFKKKAAESVKDTGNDIEIIGKISKEKIRCPLLNDKDQCNLYDFRPIACRVYGIPTSAAGFGHTCGLSDFKKGVQYPTLNMDIVYSKLYDISKDLIREIRSKHNKMGDMLVPVSMALLTDYNEDYFGITSTEIIG